MAKRQKQTRIILFRVLAIILLVVGLVLIFNQPLRDQLIKHNQHQTLLQLSKKQIARNEKRKGMFDFKRVKELGLGQALRTQAGRQAHPIGALAIPDVNLHLPVMLGMSDTAMATGGGTMRPKQQMGRGNYALAGHYMSSKGPLFSPLQDVKKGELVYLTNLSKVFTYRIYLKKKVNPYAVYLVNDTKKPIVTLITCADGGTYRWAVRGRLIKKQEAKKENVQVFELE